MNRSTIDLWVGIFVTIGLGAIVFLALKVGNLTSLDTEAELPARGATSTTSAASSCARRSRRRA